MKEVVILTKEEYQELEKIIQRQKEVIRNLRNENSDLYGNYLEQLWRAERLWELINRPAIQMAESIADCDFESWCIEMANKYNAREEDEWLEDMAKKYNNGLAMKAVELGVSVEDLEEDVKYEYGKDYASPQEAKHGWPRSLNSDWLYDETNMYYEESKFYKVGSRKWYRICATRYLLCAMNAYIRNDVEYYNTCMANYNKFIIDAMTAKQC